MASLLGKARKVLGLRGKTQEEEVVGTTTVATELLFE